MAGRVTGTAPGDTLGGMTTQSPAIAISPWADVPLQVQLEFFLRNREAFLPWEPVRSPEFFTLDGQRIINEHTRTMWENDRGYAYALHAEDHGVVGRVAFSNLVRGAAQRADVGYMVDAGLWGRGIATSGLHRSLGEAFSSLRLHRIDACIMPRNDRSRRVLEKCAFRVVGLSPRHLMIAGRWEDHIIYTLTAEDWSAQQAA
mgnify:CR=1 FL=1